MGVKHRHEEAPRRFWRSLAHGEASRRTARRRKRGPEASEGPQKKLEEIQRATWRPPKPPKRPPRGAKRRRRDPDNALNTIFGGEDAIYATCRFSCGEPRFSMLGGQIWELNMDTQRLQEYSGGPWRTERQAKREEEGEQEAQQEEKHSPEALTDIGPASTRRRPSCGPPSTLVIVAVDVVP